MLCVENKDKKAKCRTIKTKKEVRMKYRVLENSKNPTGNMDVYVVCGSGISDRRTEDIK